MKQSGSDNKQIRFLIATDVHLGHSQSSQQLGNDSYQGFEQVLHIAKQKNVDFLLLGGDLFDEVNPSQKCMYKCLNLLKENIFGDKQLTLGVQGMNPNYSNENLNISLPIFTIHGNHDYPSNDFGKLSVCDLLHASNYVNYFGKRNILMEKNNKNMVVSPLVFQSQGKGRKLAIYGIGYLKDLRLHKMLQDKQVLFEQPKDPNTTCILIIHQNRFKGKKGGVGASYQNCVLPRQFPKWMDLIVWCHEHEAIPKIEIEQDRNVCQPGSTVITSYIEAQSIMKQCVMITIDTQKILKKQQNFQIDYFPLRKSYRPMLIKSYSLDQILNEFGKEGSKFDFQKYFDEELQLMMGQWARGNYTKKPVIRIKVDYTGQQIIRLIKIEGKFSKFIANPFKIFKYSHKIVKKIDNTSSLTDKKALDIIRNAEILHHNTREVDLATQLLVLFEEEYEKDGYKLGIFDMPFMKEKIEQLSDNEGKTTISTIANTYQNQLTQKCEEHYKNCQKFSHSQLKQFQSMKNILLTKKQQAQNGQLTEFDAMNYKILINQYRKKYQQKQQEIKGVYQVQGMPVLDPKSKTIRQNNKNNKKGGKNSNRSNFNTTNRDSMVSEQKQMKSDQQDCCARAENQEYHEHSVKENFRMAEEMTKNRDIRNKKLSKNIDLK